MAASASASSAAFAQYLAGQRSKELLRLITCGSVDDGKSTLIGRLLYDTGNVPEDVVAAARADSARWGTNGGELDLALLVDGLQAEREQGITIDVAHRYFDTGRRKFVLADTPGHEQYTRNMATGASGADLAVLLIDASQGLQRQSRRHAYVVRLLGIRHLVVAVNKMDLVGFDETAFSALERTVASAFASLGFEAIECIPLSARGGDHVVHRSAAMPWFAGPTLLEALERAPAGRREPDELRLPIQYVHRRDSTLRGYAGTVAAGRLAVGDELLALPAGVRSRVQAVLTADGEVQQAGAGAAVVLTRADAVDVGRGQVLVDPARPAVATRRVDADLVWMQDAPLVAGGRYEFKFAHRYVAGAVTALRHRVDVETFDTGPAGSFGLNDVGRVEIELAEPVAVDAFDEHATTGSFIVIDLDTRGTVAAGLVRGTGGGRLVAPVGGVDRARRAWQKRQQPFVLWFTGLSGAGKSTIASGVEQALVGLGHHTYLLDGDRVRQGLNRDLAFGELDRRENIRRIAETARTLVDAGLIVLVACIAPRRADRTQVRELLGDDYLEVFVDASLAECERRDPKGHYRRARAGTLPEFTGVGAPYEVPLQPDLRLDAESLELERVVKTVLDFLAARGRLGAPADAEWSI
ncbi:MAG: adenylyl-sulfate kinase [Pseudomonadota bacterium]